MEHRHGVGLALRMPFQRRKDPHSRFDAQPLGPRRRRDLDQLGGVKRGEVGSGTRQEKGERVGGDFATADADLPAAQTEICHDGL